MVCCVCEEEKTFQCVSMSEVLWSAISSTKISKKERSTAVAALNAIMKDEGVEPDSITVVMENVPRAFFDDVPGPVKADQAVEMMVAGLLKHGAEHVAKAVASLKAEGALSPLRPARAGAAEGARDAAREAAKNGEEVIERNLFHQDNKPKPKGAQDRKLRTITIKDEPEEIEDEDGDTKEKAIDVDKEITLTFRNPAVLFEAKLWDHVDEDSQMLTDALKETFLKQEKAGNWDYIMNQHAIYIAVEAWVAGVEHHVLQVLIDQFLLRLKLSQEGNNGQALNTAMKNLEFQQLPRRYRNILKGAATSQLKTRDQFGGQIRQGQQRGRGRGNFRGNSDRVPGHVWAMLTPEQKQQAKKSSTPTT